MTNNALSNRLKKIRELLRGDVECGVLYLKPKAYKKAIDMLDDLIGGRDG